MLLPILIGQYASYLSNWTVRSVTCALNSFFSPLAKKKKKKKDLGISGVFIKKKEPYIYIPNFVKVMINSVARGSRQSD